MTATGPELPASVVAVLESVTPDQGSRSTVVAAGIPFSSLTWGPADGRPLVLIHGVTASARIWWRVGPALAATGRRVVAVDLPGHGLTGNWRGHYRFRDNALDVAAWIREAGLATADLQVVGHSWGAMTAAALPRAGIRPSTLVLLDPPAMPHARISQLASVQPEPERDLAAAIATVANANPGWSPGDVEAAAEAQVQFDAEAARSVVLESGDWDGGLADLADPSSAGIPTWIIRADPAAGGYLPDERLPAFEAIVGASHVVTMTGAPHAPQRTHAAETLRALLVALG